MGSGLFDFCTNNAIDGPSRGSSYASAKGQCRFVGGSPAPSVGVVGYGLVAGARPRSCAIGIMEPKKEHLDFHPQICRAPKLAGKTLGFLHPSDACCTMSALGPFPGEENHEPS